MHVDKQQAIAFSNGKIHWHLPLWEFVLMVQLRHHRNTILVVFE